MLSPSLVSGHSSSDRSGIGPPFLLIPDVLGPSSFSVIFSFFGLFAGLLDSAAALDTGTFFCCFASMDFRMLTFVFLDKLPERNGGTNLFLGFCITEVIVLLAKNVELLEFLVFSLILTVRLS